MDSIDLNALFAILCYCAFRRIFRKTLHDGPLPDHLLERQDLSGFEVKGSSLALASHRDLEEGRCWGYWRFAAEKVKCTATPHSSKLKPFFYEQFVQTS